MSLKPQYRLFLALAIFLLPMLACGGILGGDDASQEEPDQPDLAVVAEEPTNTPAAVDQQDPAPQDDNGNDAAAGGITSLQPSLPLNNDTLPFNTYKIRMDFGATTGEATSAMQMNIARDVPNQSVSYEMTANGVPGMEEFGGGSITFVMVEGSVYMPLAGECMVVNSGANSPIDQMWADNDFLLMDDDMQVQQVGEENLNGLPVTVYQLTGVNDPEMLDASGTLYVYTLPDGQQVVIKAEMTGNTVNNPFTEQAGQTAISYAFELYDIDGPVAISPPEGCDNAVQVQVPAQQAPAAGSAGGAAAAQSGSGYPVYPGANFIGGVAGTESYQIPQSAIDAAQIQPKDYYIQEFGNLGYTVAQELAAGPSVNLTLQGADGSALQVMIVSEGDAASVTIIGAP